jgi:ABC-type Fe3+-hydroxamate transport system substrate-binding protein
MRTIDPSLHRTLQQLVCLVPSLAEVFFACGLENFIVGITAYGVEPPLLVRTKPTFRGTGNPDVEAILALAPFS